MDELFNRLLDVFSLEYMFTVIMVAYVIIKFVDFINKEKIVPTWLKRVITFVVGMVFFIVFEEFTDVSVSRLIASYCAAIFIYDTAVKWVIKKLGVDYFKVD